MSNVNEVNAMPDVNEVQTIGVFGGIYNNHVSLAATIEHARKRGAKQLYCLGDMGGFGPNEQCVEIQPGSIGKSNSGQLTAIVLKRLNRLFNYPNPMPVQRLTL